LSAIGSLAGAGGVTLGSAILTTGNDNTSTIFSGSIAGTGGLTKIGAGTFMLTGASTYTGPTNDELWPLECALWRGLCLEQHQH
jgi:autotransporter-associated beta strand protein